MKYDLVISGGTVITPEEISQVDIGVQGGFIKEIGEGLQGEKMIDARDCYVLPGAIDPHVHLNMPTATTTSSDNWETGTKAAACGGVTAVIDFVESEKEQLLTEALESRRVEAEAGSVLDFGLHMTITDADQFTLDQIKDVIGAGVTSFKLYTTYQGFLLDDTQLLRVMSEVSQNGALVLVHCESDAIVQYATASVVKSGVNDPSSHPLSRPLQAEAEAVNRVLTLAGTAGVPA
ncbi:MAG: amidohydrolase family protein [Chloroflexi bacterium]|nr:amidohydrolase family protein [Chloroflexota bacterium]